MQQERGLFDGLNLYTPLYKIMYNRLFKKYVHTTVDISDLTSPNGVEHLSLDCKQINSCFPGASFQLWEGSASRVKLQTNLAGGSLRGTIEKLELVVYPNSFVNILAAREQEAQANSSQGAKDSQSKQSTSQSSGQQQEEGRTFWESVLRKFTIKLDVQQVVVHVLGDKPTRKSPFFTVVVKGMQAAKVRADSELCQHHFYFGIEQVDVSFSKEHKIDTYTKNGSSQGLLTLKTGKTVPKQTVKPSEATDHAVWLDMKVVKDISSKGIKQRFIMRGGLSELQMFVTPRAVLYLLRFQELMVRLDKYQLAVKHYVLSRTSRLGGRQMEEYATGETSILKLTAEAIRSLDQLPNKLAEVGHLDPSAVETLDEAQLKSIFAKTQLDTSQSLRYSTIMGDTDFHMDLTQSVASLEHRGGMDIDAEFNLDTVVLGYSPEEQPSFQVVWADSSETDHISHLQSVQFKDILLDYAVVVLGKTRYEYVTPGSGKSIITLEYCQGRLYSLEKEPSLGKGCSEVKVADNKQELKESTASNLHRSVHKKKQTGLTQSSKMEDSFVHLPNAEEGTPPTSSYIDDSMFYSVREDQSMFDTAKEQGMWCCSTFFKLETLHTDTTHPVNEVLRVSKQMDTSSDLLQLWIEIPSLSFDIEAKVAQIFLDTSGFTQAISQMEGLLISEARVCSDRSFLNQEASLLYHGMTHSLIKDQMDKLIKKGTSAESPPMTCFDVTLNINSLQLKAFGNEHMAGIFVDLHGLELKINDPAKILGLKLTKGAQIGVFTRPTVELTKPEEQPSYQKLALVEYLPERHDFAYLGESGRVLGMVGNHIKLTVSQVRLDYLDTLIQSLSDWDPTIHSILLRKQMWTKHYTAFMASFDYAFEHITEEYRHWTGFVPYTTANQTSPKLEEIGVHLSKISFVMEEDGGKLAKLVNQLHLVADSQEDDEWCSITSAGTVQNNLRHKEYLHDIKNQNSDRKKLLVGRLEHIWISSSTWLSESWENQVHPKDLAIIITKFSFQDYFTLCQSLKNSPPSRSTGHTQLLLVTNEFGGSSTPECGQMDLEELDHESLQRNFTSALKTLQNPGCTAILRGFFDTEQPTDLTSSRTPQPDQKPTMTTDLIFSHMVFKFRMDYPRLISLMTSATLNIVDHNVFGSFEQWKNSLIQKQAQTSMSAVFFSATASWQGDSFVHLGGEEPPHESTPTTRPSRIEADDEGEYGEKSDPFTFDVRDEPKQVQEQTNRSRTFKAATGLRCFFDTVYLDLMHDSNFRAITIVRELELVNPESKSLLLVSSSDLQGELKQNLCIQGQRMDLYITTDLQTIGLDDCYPHLGGNCGFDEIAKLRNPRVEIITNQKGQAHVGFSVHTREDYELSTSEVRIIPQTIRSCIVAVETCQRVASDISRTVKLHEKQKRSLLKTSYLKTSRFQPRASHVEVHSQPEVRDTRRQRVVEDDFEIVSVHNSVISSVTSQLQTGDCKTALILLQDREVTDPAPDFSLRIKIGTLAVQMAEGRDPRFHYLPNSNCLEGRISELNIGYQKATLPAEDDSATSTREWIRAYMTCRGLSVLDQVPESAFQYFLQTERVPIVMACRLVQLTRLEEDSMPSHPPLRNTNSAQTRKMSHHDEIEMRELSPQTSRPRLGSATFEPASQEDQDLKTVSHFESIKVVVEIKPLQMFITDCTTTLLTDITNNLQTELGSGSASQAEEDGNDLRDFQDLAEPKHKVDFISVSSIVITAKSNSRSWLSKAMFLPQKMELSFDMLLMEEMSRVGSSVLSSAIWGHYSKQLTKERLLKNWRNTSLVAQLAKVFNAVKVISVRVRNRNWEMNQELHDMADVLIWSLAKVGELSAVLANDVCSLFSKDLIRRTQMFGDLEKKIYKLENDDDIPPFK